MPLDPEGLLTLDERLGMESKLDPDNLLTTEEKLAMWGSQPYVLKTGEGRTISPEEFIAKEDKTLGHQLGRYVLGQVEGTFPAGVKKTLTEDLPKAMYQPGYAETHPGEMLDIAGFGLTAGLKGGAVGSGVGSTKLPKIGKVGQLASRLQTAGEELIKPGVSAESTLDVPRQVMKNLTIPDMTPHKWKEVVSEFVPMSPENVFKLDKGGAGSRIYQIVDRTEQAKNRFLVDEVSKFVRAAGDIKIGSDSAVRVGRALDAKLPVEQLTTQEQQLYAFLKDKFDFLYNQLAQQTADSPEGYKKVAYAASKTYKPTSKVAELTPDLKQVYDAVRSKQAVVKGSKGLKDLSKDEAEQYAKLSKALQEIRHSDWLNKLSPGDRQAYAMLRRKVKDYLPHIFDQDELAQTFKNEIDRLEGMLRLTTDTTEQTKLKNRLKELYASVNKMHGGGIVRYQDLPREFRLRFLDVRKGAQGYQFDAMKAYQTYLYGFARKFYGDPALKQVGELFKQVEPSLRPYTRWYIEDWAGLGRKSVADKLAGWIGSYQWMSKLGMNPRSALTNFTQRLNTIAEAGEVWSARGWAKGWTQEGKDLFARSGVAQEVPSVLMEGTVPAGMERVRQTLGFLFTKVEIGNRKHAFLTGYEKARAAGMSEQDAMQAGIDLVHKTQFRYGKVGMPKQLRGPIGRLAFQFWSYPVKQVEFMVHLAKHNPMGLAKLLAYAEGGNWLLGEFANVDMSNAMGVGINFGEVLDTLQEVSKGNIRRAYRHMRMIPKGSGLLPTSMGPTFDTMLDWAEKLEQGKGTEALLKGLVPTQAIKLWHAKTALEAGQAGQYPMFNERSGRTEVLSGPELFMATFGPKVKRVSEKQKERRGDALKGQEYDQVSEEIAEALIHGDSKKAEDLMTKYNIFLSDKRREQALYRWYVPDEIRRQMDMSPRGIYQKTTR